MPENVTSVFDRLASCQQAPPPPQVFLRAVARRRRQRVVLRASGVGAALLLAAVSAALLIRGQPAASPQSLLPPQLHAGTNGPASPVIRPTAFNLLRLNPDFDESRLVLPAPAPPPQTEHADLRLTSAWDPQVIEKLLR
jgi:hypothetical protein